MSSATSSSTNKQVVLFLMLNALDFSLTYFILLFGGIEIMPIAAWIYAHTGGLGLGLFKTVLSIGTLIALFAVHKQHLLRLLNLTFGAFCLFLLASLMLTVSLH